MIGLLSCWLTESLDGPGQNHNLIHMYTLKQTMFVSTQLVKDLLLSNHNIISSVEFLNCADKQLTALFVKLTGMKPDKNLSFSIPLVQNKQILVSGPISSLNINLYVNHNWNPLTILWKSKSGRKYAISDSDIDCDDINFWYENLDSDLYLSQYFPNDKLPFKLKNLPFDLKVTRLNVGCNLLINMKTGAEEERTNLITAVIKYVEKYNLDSERKGRSGGVVHNIKAELIDKNDILFSIDLGSVNFNFFKGLLKFLSEFDSIDKVEIA